MSGRLILTDKIDGEIIEDDCTVDNYVTLCQSQSNKQKCNTDNVNKCKLNHQLRVNLAKEKLKEKLNKSNAEATRLKGIEDGNKIRLLNEQNAAETAATKNGLLGSITDALTSLPSSAVSLVTGPVKNGGKRTRKTKKSKKSKKRRTSKSNKKSKKSKK